MRGCEGAAARGRSSRLIPATPAPRSSADKYALRLSSTRCDAGREGAPSLPSLTRLGLPDSLPALRGLNHGRLRRPQRGRTWRSAFSSRDRAARPDRPISDAICAARQYTVTSSVTAGQASSQELQPGEVAYITTGAPVPPGADAVVKVRWRGPPRRAASSTRSPLNNACFPRPRTRWSGPRTLAATRTAASACAFCAAWRPGSGRAPPAPTSRQGHRSCPRTPGSAPQTSGCWPWCEPAPAALLTRGLVTPCLPCPLANSSVAPV